VKNLLLLLSVYVNFILGLVFSLILLYASPDYKVHTLASSLFSLGSAFYMLVVYYFVYFKKESSRYTKYLYIAYTLVITLSYIVLGLISKYAPPNSVADNLAMFINLLAALLATISIIFLYIPKRKKEESLSSFSALLSTTLLIGGYILTLYLMYANLDILNAAYCYFAVSILTFIMLFFKPIKLQSKTKYLVFTFATLYAIFGFIFALVALYSSPDELAHPFASALFFISFTVTFGALAINNQNFKILQGYENGKLVTFAQIVLALILVLSLLGKIL